MEKPRVLLAGGQSRLAESVGRLLAAGCDVVGRVAAGEDLAEAAEKLRPDVIVLGIDGLASLNGYEAPAANGQPLTARQREVLRLLASGRSMREAAAVLNIAARTVAFHKYQMMTRLKLRTNAELITYAVRHQIA